VAAIPALLDSCVLYPARLRDLLLSLAAAGLFRPIWSDSIHEEWMTNVLANRPDLTRAQLEATRRAMDLAFPAALVSGFEGLIPALNLPDPDDRHALAAAVYARAELIITVNLSDFPKAALRHTVLLRRTLIRSSTACLIWMKLTLSVRLPECAAACERRR